MNHITPFKNRQIDTDKPVQVYRNLHMGPEKWYSIKQNGLIVGHARELGLTSCKFVVRQGGRKRVIETGEKNVHAFIEGILMEYDQIPFIYNKRAEISYDPYLHDSFRVVYSHGNPKFIKTASVVAIYDNIVTGFNLQ